MTNCAFRAFTTRLAQTKRETMTSGLGGLAPYLSNVPCTPLLDLDDQTRQRPDLKTYYRLWQVFVDGVWDIINGDVLVLHGKDYPVRDAKPWEFAGIQALRLIVEELR